MNKNKLQNNKHILLAADMWAMYNFDNANDRYQNFLARGRTSFKSLIESILLYDQIYIPTQDFLSLTILVGVLGERTVVDLLENRIIKFIRLNGSLAYIGNGGGLLPYVITTFGQSQPFCASVDSAINWALNGLNDKPKDPLLNRLAIESTEEIVFNEISKDLIHETYMDVMNSQYLRNVFSLKNQDLTKLKGINSDEVRIYGGLDGVWTGDEIDILLSLAATNMELRIANYINCSDISTQRPVGHVVKAKFERTVNNCNDSDTYTILREIAGIPDLGEYVLQNRIQMKELFKLTQSRNCELFKEWFHENCNEDPVSIAREYIELLGEIPKIQTFPSKILRFITTTALGLIPLVGPIIGTAASAIDSFYIEKLLKGGSSKYFIENLKQIDRNPNAKN